MKERLMNDLNQLLEEITTVTDYLYQQKLSEGYRRLDGLLGNIMIAVDQLFAYRSEALNTFSFDEARLVQTLTAAMKAMEEQDSVLLADILSLETTQQFEEIISRIS